MSKTSHLTGKSGTPGQPVNPHTTLKLTPDIHPDHKNAAERRLQSPRTGQPQGGGKAPVSRRPKV